MSLTQLSDSWPLNDYEQIFQSSIVNQITESRPLSALNHFALPGVTWSIQLYPRGDATAKPNYASVYVKANFGSEKESVSSFWAQWTLTVVAGDVKANLQRALACTEYLLGGASSWGFRDAFLQEALSSAAALTSGRLEMKLDLSILKIVDLLKCRETVRALLSDNKQADFTIEVEGEPFKVHRAIIANRCPGLRDNDSVPVGTTAEVFQAFLRAIYFDNFEFSGNWRLALGVYHLADKFGAVSLKEICDVVVADLIPALGFPALLEVLPESVRCSASLTTSACIRCLRETEGFLTSPHYATFKASVGTDIMGLILDCALAAKCPKCEPVSTVYRAAEVKLSHTWRVSNADLTTAIQLPQPAFAYSPLFLEHKAFPSVKWQAELYPCGNSSDPEHKPGFASLYLKASFGPKEDDPKAVYACWNATVTTNDGLEVCVPGSPDFVLYTGAKQTKFGYANAFRFDPPGAAPEAKQPDLQIHLDLTVASIPEILMCRDLISSLRSDTANANVEIDVNGTIFKAHKFILAARSAEFAHFFEARKLHGKIEVQGTNADAFKAFIAAVYYYNWDFLVDVDVTIDVLMLAERFGVADLKRYCDESLAHFAERSNVLKILKAAVSYNAAATKAACVKILFVGEENKTASDWIAFKRQNEQIAYDIAEAIGECCKGKSQEFRDIPSAATASLSGSWIIEDYAQLLTSINVGDSTQLHHLPALSHFAFPGLTWRVCLYPHGMGHTPRESASVFLYAHFAAGKQSVNSVRAKWAFTVLAGDAGAVLTEKTGEQAYLRDNEIVKYVSFPREAAASSGKLELKLDLTLFNIDELLKCRETIRALRSDDAPHADLIVDVPGKKFRVHKAILANRCAGFQEEVPEGTTTDAYSAFLGAVYCDSFEFLSRWQSALDVLRLSDKFIAADLKEFCDLALAELIPALGVTDLLKVLPAAFQHDAPLAKAACTRALAEKKTDENTSEPEYQAICEAFQEFGIVAVPTSSDVVPRVPEVTRSYTWPISDVEVSNAIAARPPAAVPSQPFLHKAFPGLKWQLQFYPRGNAQDSNHKPGFASLYLKAIFGPNPDDLKDVYAKWTAVVTFKDGKQVLVPASPEFHVYTTNGAQFGGYANAFLWDQSSNAQTSKSSNPTDSSLDIRLDLTIASIPEMLKCHSLLSSLHSDETYADVEIDVNGDISKAHKFILAARSSYFAGMFEAAMKESTSGKVEIEDTTPEAFKAVLAAIYCHSWDFLSDKDLTKEVLVLAEKYGVVDLKRYCDEALARFADESNVFDLLSLLQHAAVHNSAITTAACGKIVCGSKELLASDDWADFKEHNRMLGFNIVEAMGDYYRSLNQ